MNIFSCSDLAKISSLLLDNKLSIDDLSTADLTNFFGCGDKTKLNGIIGLEVIQTDGLLRSLAISKDFRSLGYGKALVEKIEAHAMHIGIFNLYLITETAEVFFDRLGYEKIDRKTAPESIKYTRQFSDLCSNDAIVMKKLIRTAQ